MSKIVLIATSEKMAQYGFEIKNKLHNPDEFEILVGSMDKAVAIARSLKASEVDVIISRGTTANMIAKAKIGIPIIEIQVSDEEIVRVINVAKKITGKAKPVIGYIGFDRTYEEVRVFLEAIDIKIYKYEVESEREIRETLNRIKDSVDVIVGGSSTYTAAGEMGLKCIFLETSQVSVNNAFKNARELQRAIKQERKELAEKNIIINSVRDIIISVDAVGNIVMFNTSAENATGYKSKDVLSKCIYKVLNFIDKDTIDMALSEDNSILGRIVELNGKKYAMNLYPITTKKDRFGVVITMQGVEELQSIEATVRKGLYPKGNTAKYNFNDILGQSKEIKETIQIGKSFAKMRSNVLIIGETGTGKELFAQSIHNASERRDGPFIAVNCGAIPKELMESELFGYVEGSFSGAKKGGKIGLFELAHNGTIFLDEISELDNSGQVRLLRVIQESQVRRIGGTSVIPINVRIIAASNTNLYKMVKANVFRKDLFYRLNVLILNIPALRNRAGDISYLTECFVDKYNKVFNKKIKILPEALDEMEKFTWDGNVRQLENFCERIVAITNEDLIDRSMIRRQIHDSFYFLEDTDDDRLAADSYGETVLCENSNQRILLGGKTICCSDIADLLKTYNGNKSRVAKELQISRTTLHKYIKLLNLDT